MIRSFRITTLILVTLVTTLATTVLASAPAGRISGTVLDRSTGEALPGANIRIDGTSVGAATDIHGVYVIPNAPSGNQTLIVTYVGYETVTIPVVVPDGGSVVVDAELEWEGVMGEEIVVTAAAQGQMGAINRQLASNTITNIVSADRIQEVPDVNAAESVGRLPGIAIQRSGGEANKVSIRGLSPKYNTVTVNGVRVPSTSSGDRSVDLSLISSNMLDGIEVRKAITADMDADAIGGAIDLKLREAPDRLMVDILAQGGYTRLQDYYGNYKFVGGVGRRFFDSRLGVIASVNVDEFDRSADKFSGSYRLSSSAQTGEPVIIVSEISAAEGNVKRGRTGASTVIDYRIPRGKVTANAFFNRRSSDGVTRSNLMAISQNRLRYDTRVATGKTSVFTGTVGIEKNFDRFTYDASLSRIASRRDNPSTSWLFNQEANGFTGQPDEDTLPNEVPALVNVDTMGTGLQDLYTRDLRLEEDETAAQMNVQVPFLVSNSVNGYVKVGGKLRWLERLNDQTQDGRNGMFYGSGSGNLNKPFECAALALPGWDLDNIVGNLGVLPITLVGSDYARDDFLQGEYPLGFTTQDEMMLTLAQALQDCGPDIWRNYSIGSLGDDYAGTERYQAGYAMAEINLGRRVSLIPGIRWERDFSRYDGQRYREVFTNNVAGPPAELEFLTIERDNAFWLPSLHLNYEPTDWLKIRLARTETLTRPDYLQYAPITTMNFFRTFVRAANSQIRPAESTNYDASVSVFNNTIGLFTIAGFQKTIDDLILNVDYNLHPDVGVLPGMNVPDAWIEARPRANTSINNPFAAKYKGIEFDWQTNFWYLPSVLKGLVLSANYTYLESETEYQAFFLVNSDSLVRVRPPVYLKEIRTDSTRTARMPDQPSHIANVTVGYDYKGFSARFSLLYQTDTSTFINATNPLFDTFSGDYTRLDLAVRQKLRRGLELFANFNNLNSRADRSFRGAEDANPSFIEYYGFTMDVGARFRY